MINSTPYLTCVGKFQARILEALEDKAKMPFSFSGKILEKNYFIDDTQLKLRNIGKNATIFAWNLRVQRELRHQSAKTQRTGYSNNQLKSWGVLSCLGKL